MTIYHFVYKTTHSNGKYYIGRHTTSNLNDGYKGSGVWVKGIKDKTSLNTEILCLVETQEELLEIEHQYIDEHYDDPLCMNVHRSSTGFDSLTVSKIVTNTNKTKIKCPHCEVWGNPANMKRWPFDKCSVFTGIKHTKSKWDISIKGKMSKSHCKHTYTVYDKFGNSFIIDNVSEFARQNGFGHGNLYAVINGRMKTAYGYRIVRN